MLISNERDLHHKDTSASVRSIHYDGCLAQKHWQLFGTYGTRGLLKTLVIRDDKPGAVIRMTSLEASDMSGEKLLTSQ